MYYFLRATRIGTLRVLGVLGTFHPRCFFCRLLIGPNNKSAKTSRTHKNGAIDNPILVRGGCRSIFGIAPLVGGFQYGNRNSSRKAPVSSPIGRPAGSVNGLVSTSVSGHWVSGLDQTTHSCGHGGNVSRSDNMKNHKSRRPSYTNGDDNPRDIGDDSRYGSPHQLCRVNNLIESGHTDRDGGNDDIVSLNTRAWFYENCLKHTPNGPEIFPHYIVSVSDNGGTRSTQRKIAKNIVGASCAIHTHFFGDIGIRMPI